VGRGARRGGDAAIVADAEAANSLFTGFSGVALFLRHLLDGEDSFPTMGPFGS
jgi:hypothetical protein